MVKIEQLNAAKVVFIRNGNEQPAFLHAMLTDQEFETLKVLTGSVVVSIDESEIRTIYAEPADISASFTDKVTIEAINVDTKSDSASADAVAATSQETPPAEKVAPVVKPATRARK